MQEFYPNFNVRRIKLLIFSLTLLASTIMCGPNLDTENFTKSEPKQSDWVGIYKPTQSTLQLIQNKGGYAKAHISFTFSGDGSFQMINMPDWWSDPAGKSSGKFESGTGHWKFIKQQEWWEIQLDFDSQSNSHRPDIAFITLAGETPPYQLWRYIGDPDSGDVMIFERTSAPENNP